VDEQPVDNLHQLTVELIRQLTTNPIRTNAIGANFIAQCLLNWNQVSLGAKPLTNCVAQTLESFV
jgi:hypothetical protein